MVSDGRGLEANGLGQIASGITTALDALGEAGSVGGASVGRGFNNLALSGTQVGHAGLTEKFAEFCERWEWGVRALIAEGNVFAQGVGLNAGAYYENEQYIIGVLKVGANAAVGNPYASEEDVKAQSWEQLMANNPFATADYSLESFEEARDNSVQGWQDAGRDAATSWWTSPGRERINEELGISEERYEQELDAWFGPSPEERAAAEGQQGTDSGGQG